VSEITDAVKDTEGVTEIISADFDRVDGVLNPANGTNFLILKAKSKATDADAKDDTPDMDGDGNVGADDKAEADAFERNAGGEMSEEAKQKFAANAKRTKAKASKSDSSEADEIEEQVTGEAAKATAYCGDPDCEACKNAELVPANLATTIASGVTKAQLKAADRKKMPASSFAYVDPKGGKHLPIHDEAHVQAALGRFGQQDFSDADDPAEAKQKAAGKIKAAAGKFGMKVDDKSDVAQAATKSEQAQALDFYVEAGVMSPEEAAQVGKGAVQDALNGTQAPERAGIIDGSRSGIAGPATGEPKDVPSTIPNGREASSNPGVVAQLQGGESAYEVPAEQHLGITNPAPTSPQIALTAKALAQLTTTISSVEEQRGAQKQGLYLQVPGPDGAASQNPGSMPWESYDSATLDQVAQALAQCCNAIEQICIREQLEALTGSPGDQADAWDLQDAQCCVDSAMGIIARLAYQEGAEAQKAGGEDAVEKAYRRLRASDEKALRSAHAAISNVLAQHDRAKGAAADAGQNEPSEGDKIQMELTKEELAGAIDASVQQALKAQRERDEKSAKKAAKQAKKAAKAQAMKNANNGGDITAQQMQDGVGGEHDADDIQAAGAPVKPEYVNKSEETEDSPALKAIQDQLKAATEQLGSLGETVQKMAKRPVSGGPILDGQLRPGLIPADEARHATGQQGSDAQQLVKSLREQIEQTDDPIRKQELGYQATLAALRLQAQEQFGTGNGPLSVG
jgi:hypothetical protein